MSLSYNHPVLLSDALERAYSQTILNEPRPMAFAHGLRRLGRALRQAASTVGRYLADGINAQAEARARDMRYSRTPW